ncbi:HET domain-containing protein [Trichoderma simmonsii]|uniref:HET domain-containing protein n=1 Tax=Trichoderma simmonsii TaxID=1491479 RepID=A0A8G0PE84_9HYPO|nr:HET domain-containing protein [Trichoderma simmonsii]
MASVLPLRLLRYDAATENFAVVQPNGSGAPRVQSFDITSYTWGPTRKIPFKTKIQGVTWPLHLSKKKLRQIKKLMVQDGIEYLWADCVCINQNDDAEKAREVPKMYEYYRSARKCHILLEIDEVWDPQKTVANLGFVGHVMSQTSGEAITSEAKMMTPNMIDSLSEWANTAPWAFPMDKSIVKSASIDMGVLNCYSTCVNQVKAVFDNVYFKRVWTYQEMLLGKNTTLWSVDKTTLSCVGELGVWMDLATDSMEKAGKLYDWIDDSRHLKTATQDTILTFINDDKDDLRVLQMIVESINAARGDILNGGSLWWKRNHKGAANVFSSISIIPRKATWKPDTFTGLLGVFSGLFTPAEFERDMTTTDLNALSFAFFKQLSIKTGQAWTKLAIGSGEDRDWGWIPVGTNYEDAIPEKKEYTDRGLIGMGDEEDFKSDEEEDRLEQEERDRTDDDESDDQFTTTDCFAGVINLGILKQNTSLAKVYATIGLMGSPRAYMKISLNQVPSTGGSRPDFNFYFRGCNCGKKVKTGTLKSEPILDHSEQVVEVSGDETGGYLVQCATILGSVFDPGEDLGNFRKTLLEKLQPYWDTTDPSARPLDWIDRCVSGTEWEKPSYEYLRHHNMSMHYRLRHITDCNSRLESPSTRNISCRVKVNCGCVVEAPFSFVFEGLTAVKGSPLGTTSFTRDDAGRIIIRDGLGLVNPGGVGKKWLDNSDNNNVLRLVAFGGNIDTHKWHASQCRSLKESKPLPRPKPEKPWPTGRALVRDSFSHFATDGMLRDYGYAETGPDARQMQRRGGDGGGDDNKYQDGLSEEEMARKSCGNLLICRSHPLSPYRIIGVCVDGEIKSKKGQDVVEIR